MAKLKLEDLSTDIKTLIIEKILRPSDLKNVCLVSREFHEIAVKPLYRNVALNLGSSNDNRLSAFLSPRNIGLRHVKQIRLYLVRGAEKCNHQHQAQLVSRMILEFLPEDILEEFSWCPWKPFSADNLLLLYKKQRKMKWLEAMDLDRDILPELKKDEKLQKQIFQPIKKLALYPENRTTLRLCEFFVQKTADALDELIIHTNFGDPSDPRETSVIEARELNDNATEPGLVTRTIFSHMLPFDKCTPFQNLTSLRLHRVSLRYCADTWCRIIDFTKIQYLRMYQCGGADTFFGQLSKATNLPKQLKVLEVQHKDNSENEALVAIDGFLCLVSGIVALVIDLECVKTLPNATGIVRHSKTLELLNVHCSLDSAAHVLNSGAEDCSELVWDTEEFEKICNACKLLEQLSCAWPQTSLIRSPSDDWRAFERACNNLSNLVTLHISTWPSNKPSTQLLPRAVYEHLLQGLAQRAFEIGAIMPNNSASTNTDEEPSTEEASTEIQQCASKLRLVAFGISDKVFEREDSPNQLIYFRSTCQDAEGKSKTYAAPISWCLRQYVEPRSDVLDFILHRIARPPCREGDRPGLWGAGAEDDEFVDLE